MIAFEENEQLGQEVAQQHRVVISLGMKVEMPGVVLRRDEFAEGGVQSACRRPEQALARLGPDTNPHVRGVIEKFKTAFHAGIIEEVTEVPRRPSQVG